MRNEPSIKAAVAEENKRKRELQALEKSKATPENNLKDLQKFVLDQLNALKANIALADNNYGRMASNDKQLDQVKLRLEEENKLLQRDRELKETLEKKKNDLLHAQKKEQEILLAENEEFKNNLEAKLRERNQELHEKCRTMEIHNSENATMSEKLDHIEKQILSQQESYKEDYETKKTDIGKHKEKIDERLAKIEEDIAKLPELTDQKAALAEELKELQEIERLVNDRHDSSKKRMEHCEEVYKKLNKHMVKNTIKTLDTESMKLEGELDKCKDTLVNQVQENSRIRASIKSEGDIQAKMKQMISDLEQKIANASNS